MARKANKRHIKSLAAPAYFGIERKRQKYVANPTAGRHSKEKSVPVSLALKRLGISKTRLEVSRIVKDGQVTVNGKKVNNVRYPIGFSDVLGIGKRSFVVGIDRHGVVEIKESEEKSLHSRTLKITGKYKTKKGEVMLRLHDGTIIKADKEAKINDSVILKGDSVKLIKLKEGSGCFVIGGVHVGSLGKIASVKEGTRTTDKSITVESNDGQRFETIAKNIIVTS
jgi:Ribosomal protein S4E